MIRAGEPARLTLGEWIAAVVDAAGDERQGIARVASMLRRGTIRRSRRPGAPAPIPPAR